MPDNSNLFDDIDNMAIDDEDLLNFNLEEFLYQQMGANHTTRQTSTPSKVASTETSRRTRTPTKKASTETSRKKSTPSVDRVNEEGIDI